MNEQNVIRKDWRNIDITFGLVYPNVYEVGMSSFSIRLLYHLFNSYENVACERIFLPDNIKFPASKDYSENNIVRSIENSIHPKNFDVLGFSVQFENDFKNILWILEKSNIPLRRSKRKVLSLEKNEVFPLLIAGGPVVTSNPKPLDKIFDLFFIGDLEPTLFPFLKLLIKFKYKEIDYEELINNARDLTGIYIPELQNNVERSILSNMDEFPVPARQIIVNQKTEEEAIFESSFFIEVNRGCPFKCKFCISSFHNRPFRYRSYESIIEGIERGIKFNEVEKIALIGSCASGHPRFYEICQYIINHQKNLTIPSIRIDHLNKKLIKLFEKGGIKTITIAPETGSEELRYKLGKKVSNSTLLSLVEEIYNSNIKNIKLYFLLGLPDETMNEVADSVNLIKDLSNIGFSKDNLRISVNPLVPKLNTPYEKEVNNYLSSGIKNLKEKFNYLRSELKNVTAVDLKLGNLKYLLNQAKLQALFSLGNEEVSDLLITYYKEGANFSALRRGQQKLSFSEESYFKKIKGCYKPWSFITNPNEH